MSALAAIAVFPILTLLLIGLSKAENVATGEVRSGRAAADSPVIGEVPTD